MKRTHFSQDCPACGRELLIRHEHASEQVVCLHCRAEFTATTCRTDWRTTIVHRADELLARAVLQLEFA